QPAGPGDAATVCPHFVFQVIYGRHGSRAYLRSGRAVRLGSKAWHTARAAPVRMAPSRTRLSLPNGTQKPSALIELTTSRTSAWIRCRGPTHRQAQFFQWDVNRRELGKRSCTAGAPPQRRGQARPGPRGAAGSRLSNVPLKGARPRTGLRSILDICLVPCYSAIEPEAEEPRWRFPSRAAAPRLPLATKKTYPLSFPLLQGKSALRRPARKSTISLFFPLLQGISALRRPVWRDCVRHQKVPASGRGFPPR